MPSWYDLPSSKAFIMRAMTYILDLFHLYRCYTRYISSDLYGGENIATSLSRRYTKQDEWSLRGDDGLLTCKKWEFKRNTGGDSGIIQSLTLIHINWSLLLNRVLKVYTWSECPRHQSLLSFLYNWYTYFAFFATFSPASVSHLISCVMFLHKSKWFFSPASRKILNALSIDNCIPSLLSASSPCDLRRCLAISSFLHPKTLVSHGKEK